MTIHWRFYKYDKDTYPGTEDTTEHQKLNKKQFSLDDGHPEYSEKELEEHALESRKRDYENAVKKGDKRTMHKLRDVAPEKEMSEESGIGLDDWITDFVNMDRSDNPDSPFK